MDFICSIFSFAIYDVSCGSNILHALYWSPWNGDILGYPYDFITVPVWIPSAMLLDLTYWATRRNKHAAIIIGGTLVGLSLPLFNMINLLLIRDPLEMAFKYPRPTLPPYMTPIEPQVGKFYNSPVALGSGAGAVLSVPIAALGAKLNTWTYRWMAAWSKWD
jgi:methane/ammonia monooxygenase subunit A